MKESGNNVNSLIKLISCNENIDVLFMLDVSESMDFLDKKLYAIREILRFYDDYMHPEDRIGFMRFNQSFYVDFEISERNSGDNVYLRNVIQKAATFIPKG